MSDGAPTRTTAETPAEILEAVARFQWWELHKAECPDNRIPTLEALAAWLPECPPDTWDAVGAAELEAGAGAVAWVSAAGQAIASAADALAPVWFGNVTMAAHRQWRTLPDPRPTHPAAPLVSAWQRVAPADWDTRPHPILPGTLADRAGGLRPLVVSNDPRRLALDLAGGDTPRQLWLGFERADPDAVPVLPLVTWDARGGTSMTRGRGAAHAIRLYVEALLAVDPDLRRIGHGPPVPLRCTLRDVVAGLWPRGWQRNRDWPRLLAGLGELARLGVEWEHGGSGGVWFAVTVRSIPRDAQLDDLLQFEVLLPPGSGPGPMVDRAHLRLLGLDSAPAYRLYLSLCWLWDHYGTIRGRLVGPTVPEAPRRPVRPVRVGDLEVNPAALARYPVLSPDDMAAMAYAPADLADAGSTRRTQRQRAREALELVANVTGAIVLPAVRPDGVRGCVQVLPAPSHKAAHDGKAEVWRHTRPT